MTSVAIGFGLDLHVQEVLLAASSHDLETLERLIESYSFPDCKAVDVQDSETRFSPLHAAIAACETEEDLAKNSTEINDHDPAFFNGVLPREHELEGGKETVRFLLENGAIWNQLDVNDETPGCIAYRLGLRELYDVMVDAGVRAELLLNRLEGYEQLDDGDEGNDLHTADGENAVLGADTKETEPAETSQDEVTSATYLSSVLSMSGDKLLDEQQNGVMMQWEAGIMSDSANAILYKPGLRVLNIGFGMGIIDNFIQEHKNKPRSHHIVEAHPDVLTEMRSKEWPEKSGVVLHEGKWQDVLPTLVAEGLTFDAIYFDTFAESYADFRDFFSEQVIGLLEEDGRWSFFNGMGADRQIIYDVYQKVVEMDLFESGFEVEWKDIEVPALRNQWEGVKRKYWNVENYRLPTCRYMG